MFHFPSRNRGVMEIVPGCGAGCMATPVRAVGKWMIKLMNAHSDVFENIRQRETNPYLMVYKLNLWRWVFRLCSTLKLNWAGTFSSSRPTRPLSDEIFFTHHITIHHLDLGPRCPNLADKCSWSWIIPYIPMSYTFLHESQKDNDRHDLIVMRNLMKPSLESPANRE